MNNKAIKILKENNLFDEKESYEINLNKFESFLKTYSFNEGISSMPKRLNRDDYGYILLDEIPYIESNINISKANKKL